MTHITTHRASHPTSCRLFLHAVIAASAVAALLPDHPAHTDALANIQKAGVIRVAILDDFPSFGSLGSDLKLQGYDIDMAGLIAKEFGAKAELVPVTSTNRIPLLITSKVDIIIPSLGRNAERAKVVDFAQTYAPFPKSVYGPKGVSIRGPADPADKTIGVTRNSTEDLAPSTVTSASITVKRYEDNSATAQSYLIGQVQLMTVGNIVANAMNEHTKPRQLDLKFPMEDTPYYVGVAEGEPVLLDKVSTVTTKLKTDGRLNDLSQCWIEMPLPAKLQNLLTILLRDPV